MANDNNLEIFYSWIDEYIGFTCPKCKAELFADSQNGEESCECGLKYQLISSLLIDGVKATKYTQSRHKKD